MFVTIAMCLWLKREYLRMTPLTRLGTVIYFLSGTSNIEYYYQQIKLKYK